MPDDTDPTRVEPQSAQTVGTHGDETVLDARLLAAAARAAEIMTEQPGDFIGRYRLVEKIGEGGFGAVWRAEQSEPIRREVALKVIKAGMDSAEIIARFEAERQALALMDHPNIAGVLDAGATESRRPYFVMELVKAVPITEFADARKLTIRERLELFIPVCQAVQHAHQKAILHRDLKPSNILIAEVDRKPVPKVIDFGIAKALGASPEDALRASRQLTQTGAFIGTPRYMSPEQAGANQDLDTRSDIYTLGVILFELLTGDTPLSEQTLRSAALDEMLRMIRESEPPRPSSRVMPASELARKTATTRGTEPQKLTRTLRGDLDWITLKALEKDRERRYGSAAALAADIVRHLHSEPVEAGPPSALYRFRKLVRRNRLAFAASAIIFLLLVAGIAVSTWQMFRAQRAEKRADVEAATAKAVNEFLMEDLLLQATSRAQAGKGAAPNPNLTVREAMDLAGESVENRFRGQPLIEAAIRDTIGRSSIDLGRPQSAAFHLQRAIKLRSESLGVQHADTLSSRNNLANALKAQGKYSEAENEHRAVLAIRERTLGPEHPSALDSRNNLTITLQQQGRYGEAEKELRAVLALRERVLGAEHSDTLFTRRNLAIALYKQGGFAEAEKEHRAVLAIEERRLGAEHPDTLGTRMNLAVALKAQSKLADAEKEYRAILIIQKRVLGAEHPETLRTQMNLANALDAQGSYIEGEKECRAALTILERMLGAEHPDVLQSYYNLARCLEEQERLKEALEFMQRAETGFKKVLGSEHPYSKLAKTERERIEARTASKPAIALMPKAAQPAAIPPGAPTPLIARDGFEYAARQQIAGMNGGDGWEEPWTGTPATAEGPSLVSYEFPARGASILIPANEQEVILSRALGLLEKFADPAQGGTWFFACLLQHGSDLPVPGGDIQINPFNAKEIHDLVRIVASDVGGALQVTLNNEPNPVEVKDASKPLLVVLRIALKNPKAGKWDLDAELFVNPPLTDTEPPPGARKVTVTLKDVRLPQQLGLLIRKPRGDASTRIDEIRFCRKFTDLAFRPPEPIPVRK